MDYSEALYSHFQYPGAAHRLFVRWWWNGNRLKESEILRELDVMRAAGIGGVEINPIRFPEEADPLNEEALPWLSEEWIRLLEVALKGARERGMICDMIVGSGWPFGGEFLERRDQTQIVALETKKISGPTPWSWNRQDLIESVQPRIHSAYADPLKELHTLLLAPVEMQSLEDVIPLSVGDGEKSGTFSIPAGEYILFILVKMTGYMAVINGAPGASGPVLNHYAAGAVSRYLNRMSEGLRPRLGKLGNYFRALFTDSLELEGANWCEDLFEEFQLRRGYDLAPYFPFLLNRIGPMGNPLEGGNGVQYTDTLQEEIQGARYDFEKTRIELYRDRFLKPYQAWCESEGVQSRIQIYGRGYNPVEASMLVDIPECETWINDSIGEVFPRHDFRRGRAYTMVNRQVSSGARLAGKRLISCEEITNTSLVFNATLERIKVAGDQSNLSGVTHSILHGFNYSPPEAPFPGWIRYGTYFHEKNPWWPFFRKWSDYKARLSALFQNMDLVAEIGVLQPLADLWRLHGAQRDPFPGKAHPDYVHSVAEILQQLGCGCDLLTEAVLQESKAQEGGLVTGNRSYRVLILVELESLEWRSCEKLEAFVRGGGLLIWLGKSPRRVPGLCPSDSKAVSVSAWAEALRSEFSKSVLFVDAPKEEGWEPFEKLVDLLPLEQRLVFSPPDPFLSQLHYQVEGMDLFFLCNSSLNQGLQFQVQFPVRDREPMLWDPETGKRQNHPWQNKPNTLSIELQPAESKVLVYQKKSLPESTAISPELEFPVFGRSLEGPWQLTLDSIEGASTTRKVEALFDLKEDPETRHFAGIAIYQLELQIYSGERVIGIELGRVHGISEIFLNGRALGSRYYGNHRYYFSDVLPLGSHSLEVKITSCLGNFLKGQEGNPTARRWMEKQPFYSFGLLGPVRFLLFPET